ncbi:hypothetical protein QTO34_014380 [Cnephaeus nilssonii]|uniref:Uncharacterized protein n=1 Tax=Cnephaeus nilssonii TaxID=3371016 RepID=A0AA40I6G3_CNENI|nr:hypothetical protein QTO34_014380 [Eptesicus nilssonii]
MYSHRGESSSPGDQVQAGASLRIQSAIGDASPTRGSPNPLPEKERLFSDLLLPEQFCKLICKEKIMSQVYSYCGRKGGSAVTLTGSGGHMAGLTSPVTKSNRTGWSDPKSLTGGDVQNMVGLGRGGMVEQVSRGARPRRGAGRCHWGKPLVVTENSLLPRSTVPPHACTCCQHQPHSDLQLAPELPLAPTASAGPTRTRIRSWSHYSHLLPVSSASPDHLAPSAGGTLQDRKHWSESSAGQQPRGKPTPWELGATTGPPLRQEINVLTAAPSCDSTSSQSCAHVRISGCTAREMGKARYWAAQGLDRGPQAMPPTQQGLTGDLKVHFHPGAGLGDLRLLPSPQ